MAAARLHVGLCGEDETNGERIVNIERIPRWGGGSVLKIEDKSCPGALLLTGRSKGNRRNSRRHCREGVPDFVFFVFPRRG